MKKLGNILVMSLAVLVVAFIVFRIFFNLVENLRLVTGGTVTQGIVLDSGSCHKYQSSPLAVQFTDTQGRQQEAAVADGCGSIGIPFRQGGDHVSIVYLSNTPTLARIQSDLILQFWVLEVPFLLIALLILLLTLRWLLRRSLKS
jgi:hypothetical protein